MAAIPSIKLNTGAEIPAIGLGGGPDGFTPEDMAASEKWFLTAFEAGYRHFDTAWAYGTEPGLGAALRASKVPREEVFITTKLPWHHPKYVERSFNDSLSRLGVDYVDLSGHPARSRLVVWCIHRRSDLVEYLYRDRAQDGSVESHGRNRRALVLVTAAVKAIWRPGYASDA